MTTTDTGIIFLFGGFFIIFGAILPFLQADYGDVVINQSVNNFQPDLDALQNATPVTAWTIIKSMASMLFWNLQINFWFQLIILEPLRFVLYFAIARAILT